MGKLEDFIDRILDDACVAADCLTPTRRNRLKRKLTWTLEEAAQPDGPIVPKKISNVSHTSRDILKVGVRLPHPDAAKWWVYDPELAILKTWKTAYFQVRSPKMATEWPSDAKLLEKASTTGEVYELDLDAAADLRSRLGRTMKELTSNMAYYWLDSKGAFGASCNLFDAAGVPPMEGELYVTSEVWRPMLLMLEKERVFEVRIVRGPKPMVFITDGILSFAGFASVSEGVPDVPHVT
jgi:hypothetical protein